MSIILKFENGLLEVELAQLPTNLPECIVIHGVDFGKDMLIDLEPIFVFLLSNNLLEDSIVCYIGSLINHLDLPLRTLSVTTVVNGVVRVLNVLIQIKHEHVHVFVVFGVVTVIPEFRIVLDKLFVNHRHIFAN